MREGLEPARFRVILTADCYGAVGRLKFKDLGLDVLSAQAHIETARFREHRPVIGADQVADAQGVMVLTPAVTRESVLESERLLDFRTGVVNPQVFDRPSFQDKWNRVCAV